MIIEQEAPKKHVFEGSQTMFRSIRCLHRHRADGGLVGASAHVVANHLDLRGRPGGAKPQRLFPKGTPNVISAICRIGVHCIFQRIRSSEPKEIIIINGYKNRLYSGFDS